MERLAALNGSNIVVGAFRGLAQVEMRGVLRTFLVKPAPVAAMPGDHECNARVAR